MEFDVSGAGATPTGSVTVSDGVAECTGALASGSGSCALVSTSAGNKTLTAIYSGDDNYGGASESEPHTVSKGAATLGITSTSPESSVVGSAYTVSFSVTGIGVMPAGSVTVSDGSSDCSGELQSGAGTCELTSLTAGAKTLVASYDGDSNYQPATDTESHDVDIGVVTITITDDTPDPSRAGAAYVVGVAVMGGGVAATGTVTIDDGNTSCNAALVSGIGSCQLVSTATGELTLTASYPGDSNYASGSGHAEHGVVAAEDLIYRNGFEPVP